MTGESLVEISRRLVPEKDLTTKEESYYRIYDRYFSPLRQRRIALLEIGVHAGASLKTFAEFFPNGKILGLDNVLQPIDLESYPNVVYRQCDQRDKDALVATVSEFCKHPDIVIDDAAHIGSYAAASFEVLFPLMQPGGFYIIEDWGTGYFANWPDGSALETCAPLPSKAGFAKRFPSHDFGLVGFTKSVVDRLGADVAAIHFHMWTAIIEKGSASDSAGG